MNQQEYVEMITSVDLSTNKKTNSLRVCWLIDDYSLMTLRQHISFDSTSDPVMLGYINIEDHWWSNNNFPCLPCYDYYIRWFCDVIEMSDCEIVFRDL